MDPQLFQLIHHQLTECGGISQTHPNRDRQLKADLYLIESPRLLVSVLCGIGPTVHCSFTYPNPIPGQPDLEWHRGEIISPGTHDVSQMHPQLLRLWWAKKINPTRMVPITAELCITCLDSEFYYKYLKPNLAAHPFLKDRHLCQDPAALPSAASLPATADGEADAEADATDSGEAGGGEGEGEGEAKAIIGPELPPAPMSPPVVLLRFADTMVVAQFFEMLRRLQESA